MPMDNACAHRGGPLGEGDLKGRLVICSWQRGCHVDETLTGPASAHSLAQ